MNATQLTAFRSQGQRVAEELYPVAAVISGVTYRGSWSGLRRGQRQLEDGGQIEVIEAVVRIQRVLFATAGKRVPEDGWQVVANGTAMKVEGVTDDPSDPAVTLRLADPVSR